MMKIDIYSKINVLFSEQLQGQNKTVHSVKKSDATKYDKYLVSKFIPKLK